MRIADQVDHRDGALDRRARGSPGAVEVGADEGDLADLAQRLEEPGAARVALGDAQANAGFQQHLADVAADEAAAAEDGDEARGGVDHGGRSLAPSLPALTRRPGAPLSAAAYRND